MLILGFIWWEILLLTVLGIAFFVSVVKEIDGLAIGDFILTIIVCQFLLKIDIWSWFLANYLLMLIYLVGYFIAGSIWSIFKWYRFVKSELIKYRELKQSFNNRTFDIEKWKEKIEYNCWPPDPKNNKDKIVRWIMAWPVSVTWAILEDLFVWIGNKLYNIIGEIYRSISNRLFAEMKKDLENDRRDKICNKNL